MHSSCRFHHSSRFIWTLAAFLLVPGRATEAAAGPDISVVILGKAHVEKEKGATENSFRISAGPNGPYRHALVFIAAQPQIAEEQAVPLLAPEEAARERIVPVPATLRFSVAGRDLPAWPLYKFPSAYVINYETLKSNPEFDKGRLKLTLSLESAAPFVDFDVYGMPDPFLLNGELNGPLADFHNAAEGDTREYFKALALEIGGDKATARRAYEKLSTSQNLRVARFARRGRRMLSYNIRPYKLSGNFREHYRWGLFMQQCGFAGHAQHEFNECRIMVPAFPDAQYRTAETLEQISGNTFQALDYVENFGEAASAVFRNTPAGWSVLLLIERRRDGQELKNDDLFEIKSQWLLAQFMIWGASAAQLAPFCSAYEVREFRPDELREYPGGVVAPNESIVGGRGWFDSVIYIRPRGKDAGRLPLQFVPPDQGPRGAALSVLDSDSNWADCIQAWYAHYAWACAVGEISPAGVLGGDVTDCGLPPSPHVGYSIRSALHYDMAPRMHRRPKIADLDSPGDSMRLWQVEGPFQVRSSGEKDAPAHHVLDPLPAAQAGAAKQIESDTDFIDLKHLLKPTGPALARATCWVYAPQPTSARMWLGQNDGMAVWINGRLAHEGRYYSAHNFEDRNFIDTVAAFARLQAGWNEIVAVIEAWPAPRDRGWGFSMRLCDADNQPIPGLAYLNTKPDQDLASPDAAPAVGRHYSWRDVADEFDVLLPRLGNAELQKIVGSAGVKLSGFAGAGGSAALLDAGRVDSRTYKSQPDQDFALNNVLDWDHEACAVLRYQKDGRPRDLMLVKPEALVAFLKLTKEDAEAADLFNGKPMEDRLLGYVVLPVAREAGATRVLFAVDGLLPDEVAWPIDEEDLLEPIPDTYVPNPSRLFPPARLASPQQPEQPEQPDDDSL